MSNQEDVSKLTPMQRIARLKELAKAKASAAQPQAQPQEDKPVTSLSALLAQAKEKAQAAAIVQEAKPIPKYDMPYGSQQLEDDKPALCSAVRELCAALHEQEDGIPFWLDKVHEQLRVAPELVHMLSDEQIAAIYQSTIKQSNVAIMPTAKAKASKAKAPKAVAGTGDISEM